MSIQLEAVIEYWPSECLLFVPSLPGFVVSGADTAELQRAISDALKAHFTWLVRHELIEDPAGEIDLAVKEQLKARSATVGPRFLTDLPSPSDAEVETALAVGRAALSDLIDAYDRPDAGDRSDPATVLGHLASQDTWYASRLQTSEPATDPHEPIDALIEAAGRFEDAVDAFTASGKPDLWELEGEDWTLAKVLRRRTAHLREHLPELPAVVSDDDDDEL